MTTSTSVGRVSARTTTTAEGFAAGPAAGRRREVVGRVGHPAPVRAGARRPLGVPRERRGAAPPGHLGEPVVAFVARGGTAKLANLRARRRASLVFRAGWEWVAVHGSVELAGEEKRKIKSNIKSVEIEFLLRILLHKSNKRCSKIKLWR